MTDQNSVPLEAEQAAAPASTDDVAALRAELDAVKAQLAAAEADKDKYLRAAADAQNAAKRAQAEAADSKKYAAAKLVKDLLDVADTFDRAIVALPENVRNDPEASIVVEGVEMTRGMLKAAFEKHGIVEIEAKGAKFDPKVHQAVALAPVTEEIPHDHVAEVAQKGYMLHDRVVRPAMVLVAKA